MDVTIRVEKIDELIAAINSLAATRNRGTLEQPVSVQAAPAPMTQMPQTAVPTQQNIQQASVPQGLPLMQPAAPGSQQTMYSLSLIHI